MTDHEFNRDWTVAPAEYLQEWMDQNIGGLHLGTLALVCGGREGADGAEAAIRSVLDRKPYNAAVARMLERGTGIPARMWLALEDLYRRDLAAGRTDSEASRG